MRLLWGVVLVATVSAGCSNGTKCGSGTFRDEKKCRPFDPNETTPPVVSVDPPMRTRFVDDVTLTTDEPATIYYTADGSTPTLESLNEPDEVVIPDLPDDAQIAFFAVDRAGNTSEVVYFQWEIDRTGPGLPRNFTVGLAGDVRTVSWVNPRTDDLAGIVVARVEGPLAAPVAETVYAVGQGITPGLTVVFTGAAVADSSGSFTESLAAGPGMVRYAAWAYDDLGNYGTAGADHVLVDIPPQTGRITINATTGTVSVPDSPPNIGLKGSAVFLTGTLTVDLEIENLTSRVLFAPKVLMTNLTGTTGGWANSDGTFDTQEYRENGAAIPPGGTVTRVYTFTGVTGTDILATDVDVRWGRVFGTTPWNNTNSPSGDAQDEETTQSVLSIASSGVEPHGNNNNGPGYRAGGITPDGFYIVGARNHARIFAFDLSTGELAGGFQFSDGKASTPKLVLDPGGATAYVLLQEGHPYRTSNTGAPTELLRIDPFGLQVNGRVSVGVTRGPADLEMSPDGRFIAIAGGAGGGAVVVNLDSLRVVADLGSLIGAVAWSPESDELVTVSRTKARIYSTSTWEQTDEVDLPTDPNWSPYDGKVINAGFGTDGRLWIGRAGELQAVNLTDGVSTLFGYNAGILEMFDGEAFIGGACDSTFYHLDNTGVEVDQYNLNDSHCSHGIARSPF